MYKILSAVYLIILITCPLRAQEFGTEGVWETGGGISFASITAVVDGESVDNSLNEFKLFIPVFYFVTNGLEIGLVPSFELYSMGESSTIGFGFYPAIAYNINLESNIYPYIEGRIGYQTISTSTGSDDVTLDGLGWSILGGIKTEIGGNILLNFGLGYAQQTLENESWEGERSGKNLIAFNIGISMFLGKD